MGLYSKTIDLQKLNQAWTKVYKNKPAAGVDDVTYTQFEEEKERNLKELNEELKEHTYRCMPVRSVKIYKGEKIREIALYTMRDKAVQQSLARELNLIFEPQFSPRTYAYRNNKSALTAIDEINAQVKSGKYSCFLKIDIRKFFDSILWVVMEEALRKLIREDDFMELIRINACAPILDETTGEIIEKQVGIHQGSAIAPVLSNVYLMEFD